MSDPIKDQVAAELKRDELNNRIAAATVGQDVSFLLAARNWYNRAVFDGFVGAGDTTGYNAWDYFDAEVPGEFATRAEAEAWIKEHHRGPDCDGIDARFSIVAESK